MGDSTNMGGVQQTHPWLDENQQVGATLMISSAATDRADWINLMEHLNLPLDRDFLTGVRDDLRAKRG